MNKNARNIGVLVMLGLVSIAGRAIYLKGKEAAKEETKEMNEESQETEVESETSNKNA